MRGRVERCVGRVLAHLLPAEAAEALVGDLLEERAERAHLAGPTRAALWYWGQLASSVLPLLHAACRRRELAVAAVVGFIAYAFAAAAENAAREAVALVATHTAVDALPVLIIYLPTIAFAAYVGERTRARAALALGALVALAAIIQLVAGVHGMPLWYRGALPFAAPAAAFAGHAMFVHWSRRAARRRGSLA